MINQPSLSVAQGSCGAAEISIFKSLQHNKNAASHIQPYENQRHTV